MGEATAIEWTDATFNPWWGCTNVSPACDHCYAESAAKRYGHDVWGKAGERRFFGGKHWNEPLRWNRKAQEDGVPIRVFCASMADVFEDHAALPEQRERLWALIEQTPWLTWQLLTKRPENMIRLAPARWLDAWPLNVWAGTTAESQRYADRRIRYLAEVPAVVRFVSYEPALGPVTWPLDDIQWLIAGGESGPKARPAHPDWFRSARDQCQDAGVAFFFKQWGSHRPRPVPARAEDSKLPPVPYRPGCPDPYPLAWVERVGKKAAGRTLDGREWSQFPADAAERQRLLERLVVE